MAVSEAAALQSSFQKDTEVASSPNAQQQLFPCCVDSSRLKKEKGSGPVPEITHQYQDDGSQPTSSFICIKTFIQTSDF